MPISSCPEACQAASTFYQYQAEDLSLWPATGRSEIDEIADYVSGNALCGYIVPYPFNQTTCQPLLSGTPVYSSWYTQVKRPQTGQVTLYLVCGYDANWNIPGEPPAVFYSGTPQYDVFLNCPPPTEGCVCDCACDCAES